MARKTRKRRPTGRKKPATLNLKATEIDRDEGVILVEPASDAEHGARAPATDPVRTEEEIYKEAVTGKVNFQRRDDADAETESEAGARKAKEAEDSPPPAPPAAQKARGGFFSHMASGLLGGILAFLALGPLSEKIRTHVPALSPLLNRPAADETLARRLAALEDRMGGLRMDGTAAPDTASPDLAGLRNRLSAMERDISELVQARQALESKSAALEKQLAGLAGGGNGAAADGRLLARIESLESQIAAGSPATGPDSQNNFSQNNFSQQLAALRREMEDQLEKARTSNSISPEQIARLEQRLEALGTQLDTLKQGFGDMQNFAEAVKMKTDAITQKLEALPDVEEKISPLSAKLASLEETVSGVVSREQAMRAEGRNTALVIALGTLGRAVDSGAPYQRQLAAFARLAPGDTDLGPLSAHARTGLPTLAQLQTGFQKAAHGAQVTETGSGNGGWMDRVLANARNVVQVKSTRPLAGNTTHAILSRMRAAVKEGDLGRALAEGRALKGQTRVQMQPWLEQARARHDALALLDGLQARILTALGGPADAPTGVMSGGTTN